MKKADIRRLIVLAQEVGYLRCDWEYEDLLAGMAAHRHPVYQRDADAARALFEEKRAEMDALCVEFEAWEAAE